MKHCANFPVHICNLGVAFVLMRPVILIPDFLSIFLPQSIRQTPD